MSFLCLGLGVRTRRPSRAAVALSLAGLLALSSSSCLRLSYTRTIRNAPVEWVVEEDPLVPGTRLASCLELLGAPTYAFEEKIHGLLLVWSWTFDRQYGAGVSVQVGNSGSASLSYQNLWERQHGLVLWFDADWKLREHRTGFLHQLIGERPAPATLEQIEHGV